MKNFLTILLVCSYYAVVAQPGPRNITLNLNDYTPSLNDARDTRYGVVQYHFVIDSTTNLSKLVNLRSFTSLNLIIGLKAVPQEIRLLSDSLERLDLFGDDRFTDISSLHYLEHLTDLTFFGYNHEILPDLGGIPNLRSVTIFGGKVKDIRGLSSSKSLKNVRLNDMDSLREINLKLNSIDSLLMEDLRNLKSIAGISNCKLLEKLHLYNCSGLTNITDIGGSSSLRSLTIFGSDHLKGLNFDMGKMKLEEMEIAACDEMRDISGIASCKTLKKLSLNFVSKNIRAINFDMSAMNLLQLRIAGDDWYWSPITDISGVLTCRTLQRLELDRLDSLKIVDFENKKLGLQVLIIDHCKSLETISGLSNCKSLSLLEIKENPQLKKIPDLKSEMSFVKGILITQNPSLRIPDYYGDLTQGHEWDIFENGKR